jgi:hypothetical protein
MSRFSFAATLGGCLGALAVLAGNATEAQAFCGFYVAPPGEQQSLTNDASMVALMRDGTRTVISMSNNYKGPAKDFALVVPVPVVLQKANVNTLSKEVFTHLDMLSAPRLVEYWEQDPCPKPYPAAGMATPDMAGATPTSMDVEVEERSDKDYGVKVEAKFTVGEYDIVVLGATQSDGLEAWLHDNGYKIPDGASEALAPYIKEQQKFFVAKVDIKKVQMDAQGVAVLSPLRFAYESPDFRLPVRLGLLNAPPTSTLASVATPKTTPKQDLLVFVIAKGKRFQVSNYPNVMVPTNLDVTEATRDHFPAFYAALFDVASQKWNGGSIVTEYAWETQSCDPCPAPPLQPEDVATLGGDVLFQGAPTQGMVLTRLHARYDARTLGADLVFGAADPIAGGNESYDSNGGVQKGAIAAESNSFQARYVIRHAWTGPIECSNPQRGIWGGPPDGSNGLTPATNLAAAPRGDLKLNDYLKDTSLDFVVIPPIQAPPHRACGCDMPGRFASSSLATGFATLALATVVARRRRRNR